MPRTSVSHPLRIAELRVGPNGGVIGVTFAPGKRQPVAMTGAWERDLEIDLAAIRAWGATHLVSLLEPWEFEELQITDLRRDSQHCAVGHSARAGGPPRRHRNLRARSLPSRVSAACQMMPGCPICLHHWRPIVDPHRTLSSEQQ